MKFKLYNNEEITLPIHLSFDDRVNLIEDKIINNRDNEFYYNKNSLLLDDLQIENITKRWIGVKKVNVPYPDESLKTSFDILSTYLLFSKDKSILNEKNKFIKLINKKRSKRKIDNLTEEEQNELKTLVKHVKFYKILSKGNSDNIVFYINNKYEKFVDHKLNELNNMLDADKEIQQTKRGFEFKKHKILNIKASLDNNVLKINEYKTEIEHIKDEIKTLYEVLKADKKNVIIVDAIKNKISKIKFLQSEITMFENNIRDLNDEYIQITEFITQV